jgi:hypothetical protein
MVLELARSTKSPDFVANKKINSDEIASPICYRSSPTSP